MFKRIFFLLVCLICLICGYFFIYSIPLKQENITDLIAENIPDTVLFTLKKGDILVRPNWYGMPGSYAVSGGRKYGHVAIVTEEATGRNMDEALAKALVVEALFFDQATRKFQFKKENQIREAPASVSFGKRFKGIRYRLRYNLTAAQTESMIHFLRNQLEGGYNILSLKRELKIGAGNDSLIQTLKCKNWHCATLTWEAFYLVAGIDIDANKGLLIYPSDIIASKYFDLPGGRVQF
jgi:hypothetical protein